MALLQLVACVFAVPSLVIAVPLVLMSVCTPLRRAVFVRPYVFKIYLDVCFWPFCNLRRRYLRLLRAIQIPTTMLFVDCRAGVGSKASLLGLTDLPERGTAQATVRCVCVSDTHGFHEDLPELPAADVLIVCGDLLLQNRGADAGAVENLRAFNAWLAKLRHIPERVVIAGNHDGACEQLGAPGVQKLLPDAVYLQDDARTLRCGLRVFGSPRSVCESGRSENRAFQPPLHEDLPKEAVAAIPADVDLIVTHGPPAGVRDGCSGSRRLLERINEVRPAAHVFGHVHNSYGVEVRAPGVVFANCASVDDLYGLTHPPVVLDVPVRRAT